MNRWLIFVLAAACAMIAAYSAPWIANGGVALNFGAYDFAEWASLHPGAAAQTPPLLTALLLRLPLVGIGLWVVWALPIAAQRRWITFAVTLLFSAALLPPLEFFTDRTNPNYQQQFGLALIMLSGGVLRVAGGLRRWHWLIACLSAAIGATAGIVGLSQGVVWAAAFGLAAVGTSAAPLLTVLLIGAGLVTAFAGMNQKGHP